MINEKDWSRQWKQYQPKALAVSEWETGAQLTYEELDKQAQNAAFILQKEYGAQTGDRIAVLAENCLSYVVLFCAAQKAGFILVPLNYRYTARELSQLIEDCEPKIMLIDEKWEATRQELQASCRMSTSFEKLKLFYSQVRSSYRSFTSESLPDSAPIFILYTSGTTGRPKGVVYTHQMLFWNSVNTSISLIINAESKTVNCMPPFHTGGWNVLMTPFLHHGGHTILMRKFDPASVLQLLSDEGITIFMGVPTMLQMMAALPEFEEVSFQKLRYIIVGGEPMAIPMIETWMEKGVPIRQGYGMTEAGPNLTSLHQRDALRKKGSIGRPNFYVQHRIVNEKGVDCGREEKGELWLKGPMVFSGYWKQAEVTQKAFHEGWFRTGDIVIEDQEKHLFVVDRIKNMYISGGENIYPAEIEHYLRKHEEVEDVAVVGVSDNQWGEVGHAFVVPQKGGSLTESTLLAFAKKGLAKYKVPKHWSVVSELPKSDTGKIDKATLLNKHKTQSQE